MSTVDLEEEVKPAGEVVPEGDTSTVADDGAGDEQAAPAGAAGDDDPALTRGLDGLDPELGGAAAGEVPSEDAPPEGVKVDEKGRWRDADGKFFAKQPNVEAAKSAREERAQLQRVAEYKAKGLDERGNKPWTPNVFGKEIPLVPGALDKPGTGILVPESGRAALTMLVARGHRWQEIQGQRQEQAAAIQREQERTAFYSEQFTEIVGATLLDPAWMEWATKSPENFETAKLQVQARLRDAAITAKGQFGAIPTKEERGAASVEKVDEYEAEAAFDGYLDELMRDEPATFAGLDKAAVKAEVLRQRPTLFVNSAEHGHLLDTRPVRIIAENVVLKARSVARPAADPAADRNRAAVPARPRHGNRPPHSRVPRRRPRRKTRRTTLSMRRDRGTTPRSTSTKNGPCIASTWAVPADRVE